jgi:cellulose synthase/poly-beta-1,6-N-acetylglucosamine synthase-like glycosyltransferase
MLSSGTRRYSAGVPLRVPSLRGRRPALADDAADHVAPAQPVKPLVSVLVPSYNHERYIGRCLESTLSDGYPNLELIIADDGSTDSTHAVARHWVSEHGGRFTGGARLMRHENRGLVKTLNRLLYEARGEFITVLASDDCLCPGSVGARVDYLLRNPRYLAVFGDAAAIDEKDAVVYESAITSMFGGNRRALRCDVTRGRELILQWCVPGPTYLARRAVLWKIGLYDERYCFEDRNYYLRLIKANSLGFVDRPVALYRIPQVPTKVRFSGLAQDYDLIHEDLWPQFRGLNKLALSLHMALRRNWSGIPTLSSKVKGRIIGRLHRGLTQLNRRWAALILRAQRSSP